MPHPTMSNPATTRSSGTAYKVPNTRLTGYLYILLTALVFSPLEPFSKMVAGDFAPLQFTTLRFFLGGLVLLPFAIHALNKAKRERGLDRIVVTKRDVFEICMLGFLIATLAMTIYQNALKVVPASVAAVVLCTAPIFTAPLARLILGDRVGITRYFAIAISLVGMLVVVTPLGEGISGLGFGMVLISTLILGLYTVLSTGPVRKFSGIVVTSFSQMAGALLTGIIVLLGNVGPIENLLHSNGLDFFAGISLLAGFTTQNLPIMAYICFIDSGVGYYFYMQAIGTTSPTEASLVYFLKIVIGPILSMILLSEVISARHWVGIIIVLIGFGIGILPGLLAELRRARGQKPAAVNVESDVVLIG